MSGTLGWVKLHKVFSLIIGCVLVLSGCIAGLMIKDARSQEPFWIIYGGNQDKGDGNGGGMARDQLVAGGWTTYENSYQVTWNADIGSGTAVQTDAAMPAGRAAIDLFCGHGCIVAGFSLGNSPALQLSEEANIAPENTYLFSAPQPSTGIWHAQFLDNPLIEPWVQQFGGLKTDRAVRPGTMVFYDIRDPYANITPQCQGPGLFVMTLAGHYIITHQQAVESRVWTGEDGAIMHEVGYVNPTSLPASGSDPSQPWAFCAENDWHVTFNNPGGSSPIPALPGDIPTEIPTAVPGVPTPPR